MTALNSLVAAELITHAENAKTVGDIDPIIAVFEARLANAKSRTHSRKGEALSAKFIEGKVAKITANLTKVKALKTALAPKPKASKAKPAEDASAVLFAQKLAALKPAERKAIMALLG